MRASPPCAAWTNHQVHLITSRGQDATLYIWGRGRWHEIPRAGRQGTAWQVARDPTRWTTRHRAAVARTRDLIRMAAISAWTNTRCSNRVDHRQTSSPSRRYHAPLPCPPTRQALRAFVRATAPHEQVGVQRPHLAGHPARHAARRFHPLSASVVKVHGWRRGVRGPVREVGDRCFPCRVVWSDGHTGGTRHTRKRQLSVSKS